jgi:hypothetical protein
MGGGDLIRLPQSWPSRKIAQQYPPTRAGSRGVLLIASAASRLCALAEALS